MEETKGSKELGQELKKKQTTVCSFDYDDKSYRRELEQSCPFKYVFTLGIRIVDEYFLQAFNVVQKWVSVGSGTGFNEHRLSQRLSSSHLSFTCVDPDPEGKKSTTFKRKFSKQYFMAPHFATIQDAISKHPSMVGTHGLFLCWPNPAAPDLPDPTFNAYDLEAICLLKPMAIVLVYETSGGSGSEPLIQWIRTFHPDGRDLMSPLCQKTSGTKVDARFKAVFPKEQYRIHSFYAEKTNNWVDEFRVEVCILLRQDVSLEMDPRLKKGCIDKRNPDTPCMGDKMDDTSLLMMMLLSSLMKNPS